MLKLEREKDFASTHPHARCFIPFSSICRRNVRWISKNADICVDVYKDNPYHFMFLRSCLDTLGGIYRLVSSSLYHPFAPATFRR